jgi:hypothetical protein
MGFDYLITFILRLHTLAHQAMCLIVGAEKLSGKVFHVSPDRGEA